MSNKRDTLGGIRSRNPYLPTVEHDPACNLPIACNCASRRGMTQEEFDAAFEAELADAEQLNEPEWPTQMQIDRAEIERLRGALIAIKAFCEAGKLRGRGCIYAIANQALGILPDGTDLNEDINF
jgi:hypothetical protein